MNPTPGDLYVSRPLTAISTIYIQNAANFIADTVFPQVPVQEQSALFFQYSMADFYRIEAAERAPGSETRGSGFDVNLSPVYYARVYAVHKDLDDYTRAAAQAPIQLDQAATQWVTQQLLMLRETKWVQAYFTTGVWGTDLTGVAGAPGAGQFRQWSDYTNSDPIGDIGTHALGIAGATGYKPNILVLSPYVYQILKNHPQVLDRIKYTQRGIVTEDILAALFDIDRVVIPFAIQNYSKEGQAASFDFIYGKHALLLYASGNPSLVQPSAGYTFTWTGYLGAGLAGNRIKRFRIEQNASDRIEGECAFDMKIVAPALGVFFSTAVA